MDNSKLFEQFPPVSTQEWMDRITADLKGADFNKKLVWKTGEGFDVKPFYRKEDTEALPFQDSLPGNFPYMRGTTGEGNTWLVRQDIKVHDFRAANKKALDVLMKGVDSLGFILTGTDAAGKYYFETLLKDIYLESIEINFACESNYCSAIAILAEIAGARNITPTGIHGAIESDPIGRMLEGTAQCADAETCFDRLSLLVSASESLPNMRTVCFNAQLLSNAGAGAAAELGYAIAAGCEYMAQLTKRKISAERAASKIKFRFGTGPDYFIEIAKLRAARMLWALVAKRFTGNDHPACAMNIHSVTGRWNKTVYDPHVNILRTQTEAMAAITGGANSVTVEPFDTAFRTPNEFSERIARNQQLILKEEAFFDKVADPAGGSYYIESLTHAIAESAWKLFVETEQQGGIVEAIKTGTIQKNIENAAAARRKNASTGKLKQLGTNHYPDARPLPGDFDRGRAFAHKPAATVSGIKTIAPFRASEEIEKLRIEVENAHTKPSVFLLATGNRTMRNARAQFARNFFGCAGYEIIQGTAYDSVNDGIQAALASNAQIAVICSSDDEYPTVAPEIYGALGNRMTVVVAGNPACIDELRSKGIEHYIHVKSNIAETIQYFNSKLL